MSAARTGNPGRQNSLHAKLELLQHAAVEYGAQRDARAQDQLALAAAVVELHRTALEFARAWRGE